MKKHHHNFNISLGTTRHVKFCNCCVIEWDRENRSHVVALRCDATRTMVKKFIK